MTRAQIRAEERRWRRGDVLVVAAAVAIGATIAWIVLAIQGMNHDLRAKDSDIAALAQQVKGLGATPVAGPSGVRGKDGKSIVGPQGPRGPKGDAGASGKPAPTLTPSPGPSGPPGKDGADSTVPGPSGAPGADSTVAGPAGPQGDKGEKGDPGSPGSPPAGWAFTYNGVKYTCKPVADFDASDPQYDCEPDEPDPSPTGPPGQQNLALDPQRRTY